MVSVFTLDKIKYTSGDRRTTALFENFNNDRDRNNPFFQ